MRFREDSAAEGREAARASLLLGSAAGCARFSSTVRELAHVSPSQRARRASKSSPSAAASPSASSTLARSLTVSPTPLRARATMSISSPQPSAAQSAHPLAVVLSLDELSGPAPPSSSSAASTSTSAPHDIFDDLDLAAGTWAPEGDNERAASAVEPGPARPPPDEPSASSLNNASPDAHAPFHTALSDSHAVIDPQGLAQRPGRGDERDLPGWMRETSGRVTAMAVGRVGRAAARSARAGADSSGAGAAGEQDGGRGERRVVAGCEDGTVWVFAPPPAQAMRASASGTRAAGPSSVAGDKDDAARRTSVDSSIGTSPSSPPLRSPLHSPPLSPPSRPWTPAHGVGSSRPESRRSSSSASLASLATTATARSKRVPSAASASVLSAPSGPTSALTSYELVRSHSRPRKASATVSVSTSSAAPSSHSHPHAPSPDGTPRLPTSPPLPPSPPTPTFAGASSLPHLVVSSPSRPPSTASGSLQSRKEALSGAPAPPASPTPSRRGHSRAKGSIATGIGLWEEGTSAAPSPREERADLLAAAAARAVADDVEMGEASSEGAEEAELGALRPVLRVLTPGRGAVVALEAVDGLPFGVGSAHGVTGGTAVLVLRQSGCVLAPSLSSPAARA